MNRNTILFALLALLFSCAVAADFSKNIKLDVFKSSSPYWIAVSPTNEGGMTKTVEMLESSSDEWVTMIPNPAWGYFQMYSTNGEGFHLPISFRLTSSQGEQVILDNVLTSVKGGDLVQTAARFARSHDHENREHENGNGNNNNNDDSNSHHTATAAPTQHSGHTATAAPTHAATAAPTHAATAAPTQHSGHTATSAPTAAPTQHSGHTATSAPTSAPTAAPTQHSTHTATAAPTSAAHSSGSSSSTTTDLCGITSTASEPVKLLVPLYVDPGSAWDSVITAAESGTPTIAIINPDSGPVSSGPDSSYTTYMNKFKNAGIEMVGYIATGYGDKSVADVEAEVDTYFSKYPGITGIFLDECSADASEVSHYTQIHEYIMGKSGYVYNIINPGTQPDEGYLDAATNIVVFESPATQWKSDFASWVSCAPTSAEKSGYKYKFSAIGYAASQSQMTSLITEFAAAGMGMVYVTDGSDECCVYNELAEYYSAMAAAVNAIN